MSCTECDAGPSANTLDDFSTDIFDSITNFSDSASIHSLIESPPLFSRSVGELYQIEDELKKYNNQLQLSISRSNSVGKMDNQITSKCYETINQNFEQLSKTKITDLTSENDSVNKKNKLRIPLSPSNVKLYKKQNEIKNSSNNSSENSTSSFKEDKENCNLKQQILKKKLESNKQQQKPDSTGSGGSYGSGGRDHRPTPFTKNNEISSDSARSHTIDEYSNSVFMNEDEDPTSRDVYTDKSEISSELGDDDEHHPGFLTSSNNSPFLDHSSSPTGKGYFSFERNYFPFQISNSSSTFSTTTTTNTTGTKPKLSLSPPPTHKDSKSFIKPSFSGTLHKRNHSKDAENQSNHVIINPIFNNRKAQNLIASSKKSRGPFAPASPSNYADIHDPHSSYYHAPSSSLNNISSTLHSPGSNHTIIRSATTDYSLLHSSSGRSPLHNSKGKDTAPDFDEYRVENPLYQNKALHKKFKREKSRWEAGTDGADSQSSGKVDHFEGKVENPLFQNAILHNKLIKEKVKWEVPSENIKLKRRFFKKQSFSDILSLDLISRDKVHKDS